MPRIDGLLKIIVDKQATELRIRAEQAAQLSRDGEPLTFTLPPMQEVMLRELVSDLLTDAQTAAVDGGEEVVFSYGSRGLGTFWFRLARAEGALELTSWPAEHADPDEPDGAGQSRADLTQEDPTRPVSQVTVPPRAGLSVVEHAEPRPSSRDPLLRPPARPNAGLAALLYRAAQAGASDLHLSEGEPPSIRVGGRLRQLGATPVSLAPMLDDLLDEHAADRLRESSIDLGFQLEDVGRFRANLYRHVGGLAAAFRLLATAPPTFGSLGLPAALRELVSRRQGLLLVCGPTGSGKSTTLASLAQERVREQPTVLITLEDPIEYSISAGRGSLIRQREVGGHVTDFARGLRDALREDPDVILIGEMRDPDSISNALTAAETGHLVMTSLHSRSAASTIERIVDTYPPERQSQIRVQLADALVAVVSQRLIPRADGGGRVPAVEIMVGTHAVANLIREGKTAQLVSVIQSSRHEGMVSMERSLATMVRGGQIRADTARQAANDPTTLASYLS